VKSSSDGILESLLSEGSEVHLNSLIARVRMDGGSVTEIRAPVPGRISALSVSEGARVSANDELALVSPDADSAWEALRAFYLIGQQDDVATVQPFADGKKGMPQRVVEQADRTIAAIEARNGQK
jgi:pyruvate/2-oxoglutarate dehydrogenase complex dihydrolipoamide acyltransferase (E2) component